MENSMNVSFPGGKRVNASYNGFVVETDQSKENGGDATFPEPYDLFLASLATCAGYYVMKFCDGRSIPTDGVSIHQSWERNEEEKRIERINLRIQVSSEFPAKYLKALVRAANTCTVKKIFSNPPEITTETVVI